MSSSVPHSEVMYFSFKIHILGFHLSGDGKKLDSIPKQRIAYDAKWIFKTIHYFTKDKKNETITNCYSW